MDLLPADGEVDRFNKVATGLTLDPSLVKKYFQVAGKIADKAIVTGPPEFPTKTSRFEFEETATHSPIDYLCAKPQFICRQKDVLLMQGNARSYGRLLYGETKKMVPAKGRYAVRVRAGADPGGRG